MDDQNRLENQLRRFTIDKLLVFHAITKHSAPIITSESVSADTGISSKELGGVLSSLSRSKVDEEPIILPVARSRSEGMIWRYNENIVPREDASELVEKILKEIQPYIQSLR